MPLDYPSPNELGGRMLAKSNTRRLTATPADPSTLSSSTSVYKMSGLGQYFVPTQSDKFEVTITGWVANDTGSDGALLQVATGTGAAPAKNDAAIGVQDGSIYTDAAGGTTAQFFHLKAYVTGVMGVQSWIDIAAKAVTGGNVVLTKVTVFAQEA